MKTIILLFTLSLGVLSCGRTITCGDPDIAFAFISPSAFNVDTLRIKKFSPNNSFQNLVDSFSIFRSVNYYTVRKNDTTLIGLYGQSFYIKPGFDWQIFVPSTNQTFSVSNITKEDLTDKCPTFSMHCFCLNKITGIKLNNQNAIPNSFQNYTLFLR